MKIRRSVAMTAVVWLGLAPAAAAAEPLYGEAVGYPAVGMFGAGFSSSGLAGGDLDGDDRADLVVADFGAGVSVLRNTGGQFAAPQAYPTGFGTTAVAIADLDGKPGNDLAVVNGGGTLVVLTNRGDGTFASGKSYPVGQSALDVHAADLDGDGAQDLAVAVPFSRHVEVFRNTGGGAFEQAAVIDTTQFPANVVAGDFNGDDVPDLAVAVDGALSPQPPGAARVQLLLGKGDATFTPGGSTQVPGFLEGLTAGDVNGDGHLDALGADVYAQEVHVLLGKGDGTLAAAKGSPTGFGATDVVVRDVDGDGVLDAIAVGNTFGFVGSELAVLPGAGDGTFAVAEKHAIGDGPQTVIADDFDGNGSADIAVTGSSQNVSVLMHK